ncbi:HYC_CC_PP family protein [Marixanthomonas spongiae]|uniref:Secreted protein n=1 Tax=Marixanthomonas spongiae TaxID=2174845 RepID=A0A2U0HXL3_9FLAO|nr:hypothetical protein [Marixanthomonas spongiae]PVW13480.1 hypothetical protein DDV96_12520 [Marixanthomonas spongiae]
MKQVFHKFGAVSMAFLVLFTTMSFTVNMHYCGEMLVDYSFTQHVKTCGMDVQTSSESCDSSTTKDSCCNDKQLVVEGEDNLKLSFENLSLQQQTFVASFVYSYINLFQVVEEKNDSFSYYSPPYLIKDISVLHQTFLI